MVPTAALKRDNLVVSFKSKARSGLKYKRKASSHEVQQFINVIFVFKFNIILILIYI